MSNEHAKESVPHLILEGLFHWSVYESFLSLIKVTGFLSGELARREAFITE
jgi:hypothetical protein